MQQTFLEAQKSLEQFRGNTGAEFAGWLRKILACQVARCVICIGTNAMLAGNNHCKLSSTIRRNAWSNFSLQTSHLPASEPRETSGRYASRLHSRQVSEEQREALILHYYQGVRAVADRMKKTPAAVAGLLQRGLKSMRGLLAEKE